jgi:hypothetical protein
VHSQNYPSKVLFIGNSYSAWYGGPARHCQAVAAADSPAVTITCEKHTFDGESLRGHLTNESRGTLDKIRSDNWDIVVLQEFSRRPMQDCDGFRADAIELHKEITAIGAETVFFMTWGYEDSASWPDMFSKTAASYEAVAGELGCRISPCNKAWLQVLAEHPEIDMWADGSHPSPIAQYLNGCVFYSLFTGESPEESSYLQFEDRLDESQAKIMQSVAWKATGAFAWPNVPRPIVSPEGNTLPVPVDVAAIVKMGGAKIYYTTDGSVPTESSQEFTASLSFDKSAVLSLKAFKSGFSESRVVTVEVGEPDVFAARGKARAAKQISVEYAIHGRRLVVSTPGEGPYSVTLVTLDGRAVYRSSGAGNAAHVIDASRLSHGSYILTCRTPQQRFVKSVLIGR